MFLFLFFKYKTNPYGIRFVFSLKNLLKEIKEQIRHLQPILFLLLK